MQLLVLALVALVSAAVVSTFLVVGSAPEPGRTRDRAVLGAGTAATLHRCRDVLLVGVDGGGERSSDGAGFGPTAGVFRRAFTRLADAGHRSVEARHIVFTTVGQRALIGPRVRMSDATRKVLSARLARAWRSGVGDGVAHTLEAIDAAAYTCPDQQVVLVGYAQGASVVHRVLHRLEQRTDGLARVVGAALVSDPDRRSRSAAGHLLGAPAAAAAGAGIFTRLLAPSSDDPASTETY